MDEQFVKTAAQMDFNSMDPYKSVFKFLKDPNLDIWLNAHSLDKSVASIIGQYRRLEPNPDPKILEMLTKLEEAIDALYGATYGDENKNF